MVTANDLPGFRRVTLQELEPNPLVVLSEPLELVYKNGNVISYAGYGWSVDEKLVGRLKNPDIKNLKNSELICQQLIWRI